MRRDQANSGIESRRDQDERRHVELAADDDQARHQADAGPAMAVGLANQLVDEEPQPALRGNPAGGSVRLLDQAELGELCQHIADARGGEGDRQQVRDHLRTHGSGLAHVARHHGSQHCGLALRDLRHDGVISRRAQRHKDLR